MTNGNPIQTYVTSELEALDGELRCFQQGLGTELGEPERFLCCHHRDFLIFLITVQYELHVFRRGEQSDTHCISS